MKTLHEFFLHELRDMYDAEQQLTKALPEIEKETTDAQIKARVAQHLMETQQHVRNLEACFRSLGEKPKAEKCTGIAGILQEKQTLMKEKPSEDVLQIINHAGSTKVENYEISAYTALIGLANMMGHSECERLLKQNLQDENTMARFLEQNQVAAFEKIGARTGDLNMAQGYKTPEGQQRIPTP
jgi:ferritin-like metal-binding protein YciE